MDAAAGFGNDAQTGWIRTDKWRDTPYLVISSYLYYLIRAIS